jgi:5-formyltetrahydrofolate cyclo-ligase
MPNDRTDRSCAEDSSRLHGPNSTQPAPLQAAEVGQWRKSERDRLIRERQAITSEQRHKWDEQIGRVLSQFLAELHGAVLSIYWPFRGEPDLRFLLPELRAKYLTIALPVVVEKGKPLQFREWKEGDQLLRGVWNIPFPAEGKVVWPEIVLAPVVGFDRAAYRLGYGGGFFDRTLPALGQSVRALGVGYSQAEVLTVHPQPYDIPMSAIVTESGITKPPARADRMS